MLDYTKATYSLIEQAQRQFNLSQRPWVAATAFRITDVAIGKKPRAFVQIENKGLTPAILTKTRLFLFIHPTLPTEFSYPDYLVPHSSSVILLPNSPISIFVDYPTEISEQIMRQIDSGELLLYAYGLSEYEDPRGNTYPPTQFCVFWNPKEKIHSFCKPHNTIK